MPVAVPNLLEVRDRWAVFIERRVRSLCACKLCWAETQIFCFGGTTGCVLNHLQCSWKYRIFCFQKLEVKGLYTLTEIAWNNAWLSVLCTHFCASKSREMDCKMAYCRWLFFLCLIYSSWAFISKIFGWTVAGYRHLFLRFLSLFFFYVW